jgi:starch phosphorylase
VKVETRGEEHLFEVEVWLHELDQETVRLELYADGVSGSAPVRQTMERVPRVPPASGAYVFGGAVSAARPPMEYTARAVPYVDGVAVPLEDARILWQR